MLLGLKPFEQVKLRRIILASLVTAGILLLVWQFYPSYILPRPWPTLERGITLFQNGLLYDILGSLWTICKAACVSFVLGSLISYGMFMADIKPSVVLVAILRCLPMSAPISFLIILHFSGDDLKHWTMVMIITAYFVAANVQSNLGINEKMVFHGFTLGMSRWQILWHRVIRGAMFTNITNFIPNFGMGWSMLSMVEGLSRASGGVGDIMLQQEKIYSLTGIAALCVCAGLIGLILWMGMTYLNYVFHPYGAAQTSGE